jgi:hypothetical protein
VSALFGVTTPRDHDGIVRSELFRSGRVQDFEHTLLAVDLYLLTVRVFYSWVVLSGREWVSGEVGSLEGKGEKGKEKEGMMREVEDKKTVLIPSLQRYPERTVPSALISPRHRYQARQFCTQASSPLHSS